jgi:hypothetical protein
MIFQCSLEIPASSICEKSLRLLLNDVVIPVTSSYLDAGTY